MQEYIDYRSPNRAENLVLTGTETTFFPGASQSAITWGDPLQQRADEHYGEYSEEPTFEDYSSTGCGCSDCQKQEEQSLPDWLKYGLVAVIVLVILKLI